MTEKPQNVLILGLGHGEKPLGQPFTKAIKAMEKHVQLGHNVYLKWTCEKCGQRVMAETPNKVSLRMKHDEPECGHISDITKHKDVGYLLEMRNQSLEDVERYLRKNRSSP